MCRRCAGEPQRDACDGQQPADPPPSGHAIGLFPPRERRAPIATTSAIAPSASATIVSVLVLLPPSELFASIVGAGASDDSGPDQSTIEPSEYVC